MINNKIETLCNFSFKINDKITSELMNKLNHIDDTLIYIYIKAFTISSIHFYLQKTKKENFWLKIYNNYIELLKNDIIYIFNINTNYEALDLILDYFKDACAIIENIYTENFETIVDYISINDIRITILEKLELILEQKHNKKFQINNNIYNISFMYNFTYIEDLIIEL